MPNELATRERNGNSPLALARLELEQSRARVMVAADALRDDLKRMTRWKGWVAQNPYVALAGGFITGLVLGTLGRRLR